MKRMITCSLTMLQLGYMTGTSSASGLRYGCRVTQVIKYYVHDNLLEGYNTGYVIAGPGGNVTHLQQGSLVAFNDLITEGPDPESKKLGRAQGVYLVASFFPDLPHIHQQFPRIFINEWNKTIAYQGDDGNLLLPEREGCSSGRLWLVPLRIWLLLHSQSSRLKFIRLGWHLFHFLFSKPSLSNFVNALAPIP